jgi:hypothetical protein
VGFHDQGVTARQQHIRDLGVAAQIPDQLLRFRRCELEPVEPHELRPAEAERAVGVAGLALAGEKEHGLPVLVLRPRQLVAAVAGDVVSALPGGMRVERVANAIHLRGEPGLGGAPPHETSDGLIVLVVQHLPLRERELEHRVIRYAIPVDQLVDHVLVRSEGQDQRHDLHGLFQRRIHRVPLRQL